MPFDFTATHYAHLAALVCATITLVVLVLGILWPGLYHRLRLTQVSWPAWLGMLGIFAWEAISTLENLVESCWRPMVYASGVVLGVSLAGILTRVVWLNAARRWLGDWLVCGLASIVFALALDGAATDNIPLFEESEYVTPAMLLGAGNHQPSHRQAYTDRGRVIPLYTAANKPSLAERRLPHPGVYWPEHAFGSQLIRTAEPDPNYNCHGWVFTGGQFILAPEAVEMILQDNGYYEVRSPRVGDIVVYYDQGGMITHTGIVRAVGEEDFLLVESKWGCSGGRYLHLPELWFSARHVYYRTDRGSHLVRGLEKLTAPPLVGKVPGAKSAPDHAGMILTAPGLSVAEPKLPSE